MPDNLCSRNDELQVNIPYQTAQDELESNSVDDMDKKTSEVASEVDLVGDEPDGAPSGPDLSIAFEDPNSVQVQETTDKGIDAKKAGGKRKLQIQGKWKGVDPVVFFRDEAIINSIKTFYGIDESFPLVGHLVSRNLDNNHVKRIYYVSKSVKDVIELNFSVGQSLKIASIGLKMFVSINLKPPENAFLEIPILGTP